MKLRNIGGVLVIDFIDMESRRDQFQLLEHFTLAIKDDSARPQIAQLTELGLVELTRKRKGQNIYELFGTKCSNCNGLGHIENLPNYKNNSLKTNQNAKKSSKTNDTKIPDSTPIQLIENQETITKEEFTKTRNTNKDDDNSNKRGNDNEVSNSNNRREKKVITVELSNDEKIVYSQLGINPLIKLGKEYLSSNHLVRLEDAKNKEKTASEQNVKTNNKVSSKKTNKITSTFDSKEEVEADYPKEVNPDKKLPKVTNENEEIETTDEIDNSRRKRRRSSANIE